MIIVERLKVENWCQHISRVVDFYPGVNGISGPNGSGKTNLLRAICFAIRGAKPGDVSNAVNMAANSARIELELYDTDSLSRRWRIVRNIVRDSTGVEQQGEAELHYINGAQSKVIRGKPSSIDDKIAELVGLDNVAFDNHVHIAQGKTAAIVTDSYQTRMKSLNTAIPILLELQKKRAKFDGISRKVEYEVPTEDPVVLQAELDKLYDDIATARALLVKARIARTEMPTKDTLWNNVQKASLDDLLAAITKTKSTVDEHKAKVDEIARAVAVHKTALANMSEIKPDKEFVRLKNLETGELGAPCEATKDLYDAVKTEFLQSLGVVNTLKANGSGTFKTNDGRICCLLCGREIDEAIIRGHICELSAHKEKSTERYSHAEYNFNTVESAINRHHDACAKAADVANKRKVLLVEIGSLTQRLDEQTLYYTNAESAYNDLVAQYQRQHDAEAAKQAKAALARYEEIEQQISNIAGQLAILEPSLPAKEATLKSVKAKLKEANKQRDRHKWLTRAKEVLAFEQIPRDVLLAYLPGIVDKVNTYLDKLQAPFSLKLVKDRADFVVNMKSSGYTLPLDKLSGGQCMIAGLAFRLAIHDYIAKQFGVMLLDEPTAFLDVDVVTSVKDVFTQADTVTREKHRQIILVTHEQGLGSGIQNKIQLSQI